MQFRKKPVVIEATQFNKPGDHAAVKRADFLEDGTPRWCEGDPLATDVYDCRKGFYISTLEGGHEVTVGDWIITGIKGEQYPCKPDIFAATYEPVTEQTKPAIDDSVERQIAWLRELDFGS